MALPPTHTPPLWMLVLGSAPRASDTGVLVPQKPPDVSYVSRRIRKRTTPPMPLLPTHTPPLWMLVLRSAPRASGIDPLVPQKPPDVGYTSRRVRHDHLHLDTSEDVNIL